VRRLLGSDVLGIDDEELEQVVVRLLTERRQTVALAESCTGGLVAHRLTNVPGSSEYVRGAVVAYANAAKEALLGVRAETLAALGAVSEETAAEMAVGARRVFGTSLAVSTTGIAGPTGGTPEKPVGTVCLALAADAGVVTRRYQLWGTRDWVKLLASQLALDWMRRHALGLAVTDSQLFRRDGRR
jgi:PncC family amidohydrolase